VNKLQKNFPWISAAALVVLMLGSITSVVAQTIPLSTLSLQNSSWQEDQSCNGPEYFAFIDDKTARDSGGVMNYTIAGADNIVFSRNGGSVLVQAKMVDNSTMVVTLQGNTGLLHRCGQPTAVSQNGGATAAQVIAGLAVIGGLAALASKNQGVAPTLTSSMLQGKWTESNDCRNDFTMFLTKGRFVNASGGAGTWMLSGNSLTLFVDANGAKFQAPVFANLQPTSYDEITVTSGGQTSYMQRCP